MCLEKGRKRIYTHIHIYIYICIHTHAPIVALWKYCRKYLKVQLLCVSMNSWFSSSGTESLTIIVSPVQRVCRENPQSPLGLKTAVASHCGGSSSYMDCIGIRGKCLFQWTLSWRCWTRLVVGRSQLKDPGRKKVCFLRVRYYVVL